MSEKKRVTCRNMRQTRAGTPTSAEHINKRNEKPEKMAEVLLSKCVDWWGRLVDGDLAEHEAEFYGYNFLDGLDAQNERYRKKGNKDRIRTMEEYLHGVKTCPEDTLYYIGCMGNTATGDELLSCYLEFLDWRNDRFPLVKTLGFGLHKEKGAYHIEEHHVWVAQDKDGNFISDQGKALEQMGVKRPDMAQKVGRYNNPKMTYTAECREKWIEIARGHGFEIEDKPREPGRSGLTLEAYVGRQLQEQAERERAAIQEIIRERQEEEAELYDVTQAKIKAVDELNEAKIRTADAKRQAQTEAGKVRQLRDEADILEMAHKKAQTALQGDLGALEVKQATAFTRAALEAAGAVVEAHAGQVDIPVKVTPGPVAEAVRSKLAQQVIAMDERRRSTDSGSRSVEEPTF